jgi:hypothetical protein
MTEFRANGKSRLNNDILQLELRHIDLQYDLCVLEFIKKCA